MKRFLRLNSWFLVPFLIFQIAGLFIWHHSDQEVLFHSLHPTHTPFLDSLFRFGSFIGEWFGWILIALISFSYKIRFGIFSVVAMLGTGGVALLLKLYFFPDEMRPSHSLPLESLQVVPWVELQTSNSFPSGHTMAAFCLMAILNLRFNFKFPALGLLWFLIAVFIGYSRIYLNQHWPFDVLLGAIIGLSSTYFFFLVCQLIFNSLGKDALERSIFSLSTSLD